MQTMQKVQPFLWFEKGAEEAAAFYVDVFDDAEMMDTVRYQEGWPGPAGEVMASNRSPSAGQGFVALNGGVEEGFTFSPPAISFAVYCDTQEEVDRLWGRLTDGGQEQPCGWLTDRFGVTWTVPRVLDEMLSDELTGAGRPRDARDAHDDEARDRAAASRLRRRPERRWGGRSTTPRPASTASSPTRTTPSTGCSRSDAAAREPVRGVLRRRRRDGDGRDDVRVGARARPAAREPEQVAGLLRRHALLGVHPPRAAADPGREPHVRLRATSGRCTRRWSRRPATRTSGWSVVASWWAGSPTMDSWKFLTMLGGGCDVLGAGAPLLPRCRTSADLTLEDVAATRSSCS